MRLSLAGLFLVMLSHASEPGVWFEHAGTGEARFVARAGQIELWFTPSGVAADLSGESRRQISFEFVASNGTRWEPIGEPVARIADLTGPQSHWRQNIAAYGAIRSRGVLPGIDVVYRPGEGGGRRLEYEVIVAAGADPSRYRLRVGGAQRTFLDGAGNLVTETAAGNLVQRAPRAWQVTTAGKAPVAARFVLLAANVASFRLGAYDKTMPLIIDPVIELSGPRGSVSEDAITCASADQKVRVGYMTRSRAPGAPASKDIAVYFDQQPLAVVVTGGSGDEMPVCGVRVVTNFSLRFPTVTATVAGETTSRDFAGASNFFAGGARDGFIARLSVSLNTTLTGIIGSANAAYLGGSGDDSIQALLPVQRGGIFVVGFSDSTDLADAGGLQSRNAGGYDGFIAWQPESWIGTNVTTYFGGTGNDYVRAASLDPEGRILIAGETESADLPLRNPVQSQIAGAADAFLARVTPNLDGVELSTYWGGSGRDSATGVAHDPSHVDSVYLAGTTWSEDFPVSAPAQDRLAGPSDGFLLRMTAGNIGFATYWGGSREETVTTLAISVSGDPVIAGASDSPDLRVEDAVQTSWRGGTDAFVAMFDANTNAPLFSTYLGGESDDQALHAAFTAEHRLVVAGSTASTGFPRASDSTVFRGGSDGFYSRLRVPFIPVRPVPLLAKGATYFVAPLPFAVSSSASGKVLAERGSLTGLADSGEATATVTASGYYPRTMSIRLTPLAFGFRASTVEFSSSDPEELLEIAAFAIDAWTGWRLEMPGIVERRTEPFRFTSSEPAVAEARPFDQFPQSRAYVQPRTEGVSLIRIHESPGDEGSLPLRVKVSPPGLSIECTPLSIPLGSSIVVRRHGTFGGELNVRIDDPTMAQWTETESPVQQRSLSEGTNSASAHSFGIRPRAAAGKVEVTAWTSNGAQATASCPIVPAIAAVKREALEVAAGSETAVYVSYHALDRETGRLRSAGTLAAGITPRLRFEIEDNSLAENIETSPLYPYSSGAVRGLKPGVTTYRLVPPEGFADAPEFTRGKLIVKPESYPPGSGLRPSSPVAVGFESELTFAPAAQITLRSLDPNRVLMTTRTGTTGSAQVTLQPPFGTVREPYPQMPVFLQGISPGPAFISIENPGRQESFRFMVEVLPSGFVFSGGTGVKAARANGPPVDLSLHAVAIGPDGELIPVTGAPAQPFVPLMVELRNDAPETGRFVTNPIRFQWPAGFVSFRPAAPGIARLRILPPIWFSEPPRSSILELPVLE